MTAFMHVMPIFLLISSCCITFGVKSQENISFMDEKGNLRKKRALSPMELGAAAAQALLRGAIEVSTKGRGFNKFEKLGTKSSALKEFMAVEPSNVKHYLSKYGEDIYEGKIGDRTIFYNSLDPSQQRMPTITIFDPKRAKEGIKNLSDKIVFVKSLDVIVE